MTSATTALTRLPSALLPRCALSFLERAPIDLARARQQHAAYRTALAAAGLTVVVLDAIDDLPDAVFVEDTAIVLDEMAIVASMAEASRRAESAPMADVLRAYRPVHALAAPATLDGGDVLPIGRTLYVGQTARTNRAAVEQLATLLGPLGYRVLGVPITGCLHLKSAAGSLGDGRVVVNPDWIAPETFAGAGIGIVTVDRDEPWGANVLALGGTVLVPASTPRTMARLRQAGMDTVSIDIAELQKAEAGLTCMSIVI